MKISPWYPGNTDPVRGGVYQRKIGNIRNFSRWNGSVWFRGCYTIGDAYKERRLTIYTKDAFRWRGLAENPKGVK